MQLRIAALVVIAFMCLAVPAWAQQYPNQGPGPDSAGPPPAPQQQYYSDNSNPCKEISIQRSVYDNPWATAGVDPAIMGSGPIPASRKALEKAGWKIGDLDLIEANEAFAAQGIAVLRMLGLQDDDPRVNPNGGAIALGHPLGASGARLVTTATNQLHRTGGRYALCTMCIGVGQGIAVVIERV